MKQIENHRCECVQCAGAGCACGCQVRTTERANASPCTCGCKGGKPCGCAASE